MSRYAVLAAAVVVAAGGAAAFYAGTAQTDGGREQPGTTVDVYAASGNDAVYYDHGGYFYFEHPRLETRLSPFGLLDGARFGAELRNRTDHRLVTLSSRIASGNGVMEWMAVPRYDDAFIVRFIVDAELREAIGRPVATAGTPGSLTVQNGSFVRRGEVFTIDVAVPNATGRGNPSLAVFIGSDRVDDGPGNATGIGLF